MRWRSTHLLLRAVLHDLVLEDGHLLEHDLGHLLDNLARDLRHRHLQSGSVVGFEVRVRVRVRTWSRAGLGVRATCSSRSECVSETVVVGGAWSLRYICSRVGLLRAISSRVAGRDSVAGWESCGCCCCCRCSALGPRSPPTHTSMAVGCPASIAPAALMCSPCGLPLAR